MIIKHMNKALAICEAIRVPDALPPLTEEFIDELFSKLGDSSASVLEILGDEFDEWEDSEEAEELYSFLCNCDFNTEDEEGYKYSGNQRRTAAALSLKTAVSVKKQLDEIADIKLEYHHDDVVFSCRFKEGYKACLVPQDRDRMSAISFVRHQWFTLLFLSAQAKRLECIIQSCGE